MSNNQNVGKVFNLTVGGGRSLRLRGLSITKQPAKTTYQSGETFDSAGMVVTANYGYGITTDVTDYTITPDILTASITEVIITYTEGQISKTAVVAVIVKSKALNSISISAPPAKITYQIGETFDPAGMIVTAKFSDNSEEIISGYSYPVTEFSESGPQTMTFSYTYEGITKQTSLTVTVKPNNIEVPIPTVKSSLTYDGSAQSPEWINYDPSIMTMTGDTAATNAGYNYEVKFTLSDGYVFPDGSRESTVSWLMLRSNPTITVEPNSINLNSSVDSLNVKVTTNSDGEIFVGFIDPSNVVSRSSIDQDTGVFTVHGSPKLDDSGNLYYPSGTATMVVYVNQGLNYYESDHISIPVSVDFD